MNTIILNMELHLNVSDQIEEKENLLQIREMLRSGESAALLPTAGLNVNSPDRGVCMSWVLVLGPAMCRDSHP